MKKEAIHNIHIRRMMRHFLKVASLEQLELLATILERCIEKRKRPQVQQKNDHIA